mmetsp:Transcript_44741/g.59409  ORF Transcript_44741/g.59409 Transcript_44741/m.59409 type:complete len:86 (-) Transcript_44741:2094-2351(-)|eukprot:CAMPEP_0185586238 /NCGR_PEP_ID=MMETSP0434-20130131/43260_1 /TAXON_ID=626734 ORGANISM="Favella taraikaensis, Strain Fe Narragansett Bay" /NCGR_SAMPLE_ID=MMETSP0434 /ASSEMBLY_ACC=CAM_ASM_000379 /LENGTH=85 /DNA_ID=CAMNT_0028207203 /DNA_START=218 /DNA_END=475 /DNA_ORIENTATION=+
MITRDVDQETFDQALKKNVIAKEADEAKVVETAGLEVRYLPSEFHPVPPKMTWRFKKWRSDTRLVLELRFDNPEIVSMETPSDSV